RNRQTNKYIEKELNNYQEQLCGAKIRKAEVINQSRIANEPLVVFAPHSPVIMDYERLGEEITKISKMPASTTEKLLTSQRKLVYPVSFRLDVANWERLNKLLEKVNEGRVRKVNLTQLVKALIYCGG
ncbi:13401_t:CDS:2, partial [Cetraspora pellucida]